MHPAHSVIFFTVMSGAGLGLLAVLGLAPLFDRPLDGTFGWTAFVLAFGLSVAGLVSSTFHLGHPERAWRAFTQWRSSWLSREAVLAVATLSVGGLFAVMNLFGGGAPAWMGLVLTVLSAATVYATAMIYAGLRTVPMWHTPVTAVCYLAFAAASGILLLLTVDATVSATPTGILMWLAAGVLIVAWVLKAAWWQEDRDAADGSSPETATGLGHLGKVRLFEAPHSGPNYLLNEMGYQVARKHAAKMRQIAIGLGAIVPLVAIGLALLGMPFLLVPALIAHLVGMLAERWLFFAEAKHAVMHYYTR
ncbi:MAG: DmsC/YnfH family molybdoenzyme membrane anchor subunit [Pseudomonadota bacterium]